MKNFSFLMFSLRDKPEKFTEDSESLRPTSPDDLSSVVSCSTSDAVIIEGNTYSRISCRSLRYKWYPNDYLSKKPLASL